LPAGAGIAVKFGFSYSEMKSLKFSQFNGIALLLSVSALLSSCGRGLPSKLEHLPEDLNGTGLNLTGIYPDGWVGDSGSVTLQQPAGKQMLSIRGTVPLVGDPNFRSDVELRLEEKAVGHWNIGLGDFALSASVPPGAGTRRVTIVFGKSQQLPGGDGRMVGARLSFIGFESKSAMVGPPSDVMRSSNLQLGSGWGVLETFHNENFRWVDNDAQFLLAADQPGSAVLSVTVEPGPGVAMRPFVLRVLDASGHQVSAEPVEKRRTTVKFILPVEGKPSEFRLHVDGGGKPALNDPRILNFRVFEMEAGAWKPGK